MKKFKFKLAALHHLRTQEENNERVILGKIIGEINQNEELIHQANSNLSEYFKSQEDHFRIHGKLKKSDLSLSQIEEQRKLIKKLNLEKIELENKKNNQITLWNEKRKNVEILDNYRDKLEKIFFKKKNKLIEKEQQSQNLILEFFSKNEDLS